MGAPDAIERLTKTAWGASRPWETRFGHSGLPAVCAYFGTSQMRMSWRGGLFVFFGTILLALLFISIGRFELARPTMLSVAMDGLVITMRWKLRKHVWFWITVTILNISNIY
jgi:hypothetical protein